MFSVDLRYKRQISKFSIPFEIHSGRLVFIVLHWRLHDLVLEGTTVNGNWGSWRGVATDLIGATVIVCHFVLALADLFLSPQELESGLVEAETQIAMENSEDCHLYQNYEVEDSIGKGYPPIGVIDFEEENEADCDSQGHVDDDYHQETTKKTVIFASNAVIKKDAVMVKL